MDTSGSEVFDLLPTGHRFLLLTAKQQHSFLDNGINRSRCAPLFIRLTKPGYCTCKATKKGNSDGTMGSKSKTGTMKSYRILKNEAEQKLKQKKKENAPDILSKSVFNARAMVVREYFNP
ncbi:MAG TPA: hypothetical protein ENH60_02855 [Pricia sp.]|nr:hypothetical protein [Pricia sp.]